MKTWGIVGSILFALAVAFGYFFGFDGATVIEIAIAAFGLTAIIVGAVKAQKEKSNFSLWKTVIVIALASIGGVLVCLGGLQQSIFQTISGAVLALLAVILGIYYAKETK